MISEPLFRPQYNSEFNGIVVAAADADRTNIKADDQLASHARQLLDAVMSPSRRTTTQNLNQLIQLVLPSGRPAIHDCAAAMGLTVRTLQRMLDAEQTSFSALLNSARMELAVQYLANRRCGSQTSPKCLSTAQSAHSRGGIQALPELLRAKRVVAALSRLRRMCSARSSRCSLPCC